MISDDEITKLLEDIPAPESLADEDFSTAWEPDKLYDQKDDDFLAQSETFTQELDKQHTEDSMTKDKRLIEENFPVNKEVSEKIEKAQ